MTEIEALLEIVKTYPEGPIDRASEAGVRVVAGLMTAWSHLAGTSDQSTFAYKLGRIEMLAWSPPRITFVLERHGGTVNGSSRADLHSWEVDLEKGEARIASKSFRQLKPPASRLDCGALAREIAAIIDSGGSHSAIDWDDATQTVTIKLGILIPDAGQRTTSGRRKR